MSYDVDILASRKRGMLTIGVTNDIARRAWKVRLIERDNADRDDLCDRLNGEAIGSRQQVPGRQSWLWQGRASPA
jgi:predicted GIY-YIG superfamily endonuclease